MTRRIVILSGFHASGHERVGIALAEAFARRRVATEYMSLPGSSRDIAARAEAFRLAARSGSPIDDGELGDLASRLHILDVMRPQLEHALDGADDVVAVHPLSAWLATEVCADSTRHWHVHTDYTPGPVFYSDRFHAVFGPRVWPERMYDAVEQTGIPAPVSTPRTARIDRPIAVLLVGGSDGFGPIRAALEMIDRWRPLTTVVTGRNRQLYAEVLRDFPDVGTVHGWVDLPRLMSLAQVVITKASGVTLTEAFRSGCACICTPPVVRWEAEAGAILSAQGCVIQLPDFTDRSKILLDTHLRNSALLDLVGQRGFELHGASDALEAIVERVLSGERSWPHDLKCAARHAFDLLRFR